MKRRTDEDPHMSIYEQAAEWFVRWHSGDMPEADRRNYLLWLKTSPIHIAELLRACRVYCTLKTSLQSFDEEYSTDAEYSFEAELPHAARTYPVDTATLIRQAREELAARPSEHVAGLLHELRTPPERQRAYPWRAVATVFATLIAALTFTIWTGREIHTDLGEWRYATLADGTLMTLGPRTELRLDFGDARRVIHMQRGNAYFEVAKDPRRSFVVCTPLLSVRAVGTQFEVAVSPAKDEVTVTVKEGRVAVSSKRESMAERAQDAAELLRVEGGQQLKASVDSSVVVKSIDLERELGWAHKRLVFEGDTLADAIAQFNRLNRVQIVVDKTLAGRLVNGVFDADDPASFAQTISKRAQVVLKEGPDTLRLEARAANAKER